MVGGRRLTTREGMDLVEWKGWRSRLGGDRCCWRSRLGKDADVAGFFQMQKF